MHVHWGFTGSFDDKSVTSFTCVRICFDLCLFLDPQKRTGKSRIKLFYPPSPMCCRMIPWVSHLLSSLVLICKSWWGAATPLLEVVFHWLLDFSIRKFFLHSVIIDDDLKWHTAREVLFSTGSSLKEKVKLKSRKIQAETLRFLESRKFGQP